MINSNELEAEIERNAEARHSFIKQWATYVREHDDAEWSRQQNKLIDAQLRRARNLAKAGEIQWSTDEPERVSKGPSTEDDE